MEAEGNNNNIVRFTYTGEEEIPDEATHVFISVRVVPRRAFQSHPNIVEVICGKDVEKIEQFAFWYCPNLRGVIMPGVKIIEEEAFYYCEALTVVECGKLEIIKRDAFHFCKSLRRVIMPGVKVIECMAFNWCSALTHIECGRLEIIGEGAFGACSSLSSIRLPSIKTVERRAFGHCKNLISVKFPLKDGMISADDTFWACESLNHVDLIGGVHETVAALLMEEWKNDINREIDSVNQILPSAPAGDWSKDAATGEFARGEKAREIRRWIGSVLRKVVHYKAEHRRYLNIAAETLQPALPNEIVMSNILPFLELPSHTFEGEDLADEDEPPAAAALEPALPLALDQDSVVNVEVEEEEQVNHHFFDLSSVALSLVIVIVSILMGTIINLVGSKV